MFSWHKDTENLDKASYYRDDWRWCYSPTAGEIARIMSHYMCSNCVWNDGVRGKKNFRVAEWVALDIDEGMTLEEGKQTFEPYMHVIGTTRNHQKAKGDKPACDRFRVFIRLSEAIKDADQLEETQRQLAKKYGADMKAVDAARMFYPCKEIIVSKYMGKVAYPADLKKIEAQRKATNDYLKKRNARLNAYYVPGKILPPRTRQMLDRGVPDGQRSTACWQVARDCKKHGYTESEALEIIWNSAIPLDRSDECFNKVRSQVQIAYRQS